MAAKLNIEREFVSIVLEGKDEWYGMQGEEEVCTETYSPDLPAKKLTKLFKKELKKAFEAGYKLGEYDGSMVDWERMKKRPEQPTHGKSLYASFKSWLNLQRLWKPADLL